MMRTNTSENESELPITARMHGQGPGVLFIHGWNHSRRIWNATISELGNKVTSVAIDLPGFGKSPSLAPSKTTLTNFSSLTERIILAASQLLDKRDCDLHTVVGDSLGAILILELLRENASLTSQKTKRIILRSPKDSSMVRSKNFESPGLRHADRIVLSGCPPEGLPDHISSIKNLNVIKNGLSGFSAIPKWASKSLLRVLSLGTVHRFEDVNDDLVESVLRADPTTSEILFREIADYSFEPEQVLESKLPSDISVIRGEWDRVTSKSNSRDLANQLEGTYCEIPKVGHTPMIEVPNAYAQIVKGKI